MIMQRDPLSGFGVWHCTSPGHGWRVEPVRSLAPLPVASPARGMSGDPAPTESVRDPRLQLSTHHWVTRGACKFGEFACIGGGGRMMKDYEPILNPASGLLASLICRCQPVVANCTCSAASTTREEQDLALEADHAPTVFADGAGHAVPLAPRICR